MYNISGNILIASCGVAMSGSVAQVYLGSSPCSPFAFEFDGFFLSSSCSSCSLFSSMACPASVNISVHILNCVALSGSIGVA